MKDVGGYGLVDVLRLRVRSRVLAYRDTRDPGCEGRI